MNCPLPQIYLISGDCTAIVMCPGTNLLLWTLAMVFILPNMHDFSLVGNWSTKQEQWRTNMNALYRETGVFPGGTQVQATSASTHHNTSFFEFT